MGWSLKNIYEAAFLFLQLTKKIKDTFQAQKHCKQKKSRTLKIKSA